MKVHGILPIVVYIRNFGNDNLIIPIGRDINVLIIGKFLPISAPNRPYFENQESLFSISSDFIKKYLPYFWTNGLPPKYPMKYIAIAQNTLPSNPVKKARGKEKILREASIPPVAKTNSLGIIIITASNTIAKNIPK